MAKPPPQASRASVHDLLTRELHDGICQELSAILFLAKCLEQRLETRDDGKELQKLTGKISEAATRSIDKAQELVRKFS